MKFIDMSDYEDEPEKLPTDIQLEAMLMTLREVKERFNSPCPFASGDIITPRRGHNYKHVGLPFMVLGLIDPPIVDDKVYGGKSHDIRVAMIVNDSVIITIAESWAFEKFPHSTDFNLDGIVQ